jgi:hypothetical protein
MRSRADALRGCWRGPGLGGEEEGGVGVAAELVAEDAEGAGAVPEGAGHRVGGAPLDEVGAQRLVHPLLAVTGLQEAAAASR